MPEVALRSPRRRPRFIGGITLEMMKLKLTFCSPLASPHMPITIQTATRA